MSTPLLSTKLFIPPLKPELVPRPRLNAGMARKLTLVSAAKTHYRRCHDGEWVPK